MNVYIYKAALYCEPCARELPHVPFTEAQANDYEHRDSEHWPVGPYPNGGGEADTPQHCDSCGLFLENPLTAEGIEYVREALARHEICDHARGPILDPWDDFYADALAS